MTIDYNNPTSGFLTLRTKVGPKVVPADNWLKRFVANADKPKVLEPTDVEPKHKKPALPSSLWDQAKQAIETPVVTEAKEVVEIRASDQLAELVGKALKKQHEILDMRLDSNSDNFPVILRAQVSVCEKIMNTQTKVDDNALKARNDTRIGDILDKMLAAEKQLTINVAVGS